MILGWLIKHTAVYEALAERLKAEEAAHAKTALERDEYRQRFIERCEYEAVSDGKPRFSVAKPNETKVQPSRVSSIAEEFGRRQSDIANDFNSWLNEHPEEKMRAAQLRKQEGLT